MIQRLQKLLTRQRVSYAWVMSGALWLAWLVSILLGPNNLDLNRQVVGADYIQFYAAGQTLGSGEQARLYDFEYQRLLEHDIAGHDFDGYHAFINPPFHAWLFVPFSILPYAISFAVWSLGGLALLRVSLYLLEIRQPNRVFFWSLTWFPVFASISFGQNSLLSLGLFSLSFFWMQRQRPFFAGLTASLLLYKPQLVLGLGLLWLLEWRQNRTALLGLGIGAGMFLGLSIGLLPDASRDYFTLSQTIIPNMAAWEGFPIYNAHMLRAFWILLLPGLPQAAEVLALLFSLAGVLGFIYFWKEHRYEPVILYAAVICLTVWCTPHAMIYDWVLLLIPAALLWDHYRQLRSTWQAIFALVWLATLLSGPLTLAQRTILPISIQVSLPVFAWSLFAVMRSLKQQAPKVTTDQGISLNPSA